MESLNLNTLANSLPTAQQNAEKELLNDFKAAALSITTLYRSSRKNSKRAYNAGYAAACQDLLNFIQQGVSAGDIGQAPSHAVEGGGMTIGRVMDWTEARAEAIKAREEEEDEDEERERDKDRASGSRPPAGPTAAVVPVPVVSKPDGQKSVPMASAQPNNRLKSSDSSLPTPNSPISHLNKQLPSGPPSPSPPPPTLSRASGRPTKVRPTTAKEVFHPTMQQPTHVSSSTYVSDPLPSSTTPVPFPETPFVIGAGAKRRHAMMMMLDSNSPAISIGGPSSNASSPGGVAHNNPGTYSGSTGSNLSRRRMRSSRNLTQLQPHNPNIVAPEDMDVEEDGRERKRVARR